MPQNWFVKKLKQLGKTQEDLASAIGRDRTVVSKIISGKVEMRMAHVRPLAQALGVSTGEILAHGPFPELLDDFEAFDRKRMAGAIAGVLDWYETASVDLQPEELADAILMSYDKLQGIDPDNWAPMLRFGMDYRASSSAKAANNRR